MEIKSTLNSNTYGKLNVTYRDINSKEELKEKMVKDVHAYCFYGGKLVIVYNVKKKYWTLPGGGVEVGESIDKAVAREVKEESNMKVIAQRLIGYQEISEPDGIVIQTRSVCLTEPFGEFVNDPDGDIVKIKLINPDYYKKYIDWGEIGDHLIRRALNLNKS